MPSRNAVADSVRAKVAKAITAHKQERAIAAAKARPDKTIPAGGGDETEARIIESLADPGQRPLTIEQRCELLGISRSTWYRHMEDPLFKTRARQAWQACCRNDLGSIMQALVDSAVIVGRDGHRDRKLFLELVGEYEPGQRLHIEENGSGPKKPGAEMSDEELVLMFEGREHLLPPGVQRRLGIKPNAGKDAGRTHGGKDGSKGKKAAA